MPDRSESQRSPTRTIPTGDDAQDLTLPPGPGPDVVRGARPGSVEPVSGRSAPVRPVSNGGAADPDEVRREIEATRARISGTLDQIEGRLVREKEQLGRKTDELWAKATFQGVRRKISEEPFRSMAIAFVAGYIVAAIRD